MNIKDGFFLTIFALFALVVAPFAIAHDIEQINEDGLCYSFLEYNNGNTVCVYEEPQKCVEAEEFSYDWGEVEQYYNLPTYKNGWISNHELHGPGEVRLYSLDKYHEVIWAFLFMKDQFCLVAEAHVGEE